MLPLCDVFDLIGSATAALADGKLDNDEAAALLEKIATAANDISMCFGEDSLGGVVRGAGLVISEFASLVDGNPDAGPDLVAAFGHLLFASANFWRGRMEK